jgi:hypothetical protein
VFLHIAVLLQGPFYMVLVLVEAQDPVAFCKECAAHIALGRVIGRLLIVGQGTASSLDELQTQVTLAKVHCLLLILRDSSSVQYTIALQEPVVCCQCCAAVVVVWNQQAATVQ